MKTFCAATIATVFILGTPAMAKDQTSTVSAGVTAGTLGIGPEVAVRLTPLFGIRGSATFLSASHSVDSDDITYDGKLKLGSVGLMADLHPFKGGFTISGGFRLNSNKVRLKASPTDDVEIGDETYSPDEIGNLSGTVKPKNFSPALTVGYSGGLTKGIKFGVEAGALFQGSLKIHDLKASNDGVDAADLAEEEKNVEDDIKKYKVYPILQVSLRYAF